MQRSIIDKLLPDDILGVDLYHYTSADGLLGILSDKVVRCSHIFYLNDIEENLNGWEFFFGVFESLAEENSKLAAFRNKILGYFLNRQKMDHEDLSRKIFENMHRNRFYSFIFSLSLIPDDLNQWRSYAEEPFGFCIRFNFDREFRKRQHILRNGDNCSILLRQCVYDPDEKAEKIKQLLMFHFEECERGQENWMDHLFRNALELSLFFKNEKFAAEKECRLVVSTALDPFRDGKKEISLLNMRRGKSYLIPFIELQNDPGNVKSITIGPTPFKQLSYSALKMLQDSLESAFGHIEIRHSEVPYRSW